MNIAAASLQPAPHVPARVLTATALFDGHDAAINMMRRLIQEQGAEVIHLGHNRGVEELVRAALQEDVQGLAVSSYQGGHMEFFRYLVDRLRAEGAGHIRVFGGGGGTISRDEAAVLEGCGVERVYDPEEGRRIGLVGMAQDLLRRAASAVVFGPDDGEAPTSDDARIGWLISMLERRAANPQARRLREGDRRELSKTTPVIGITGVGGAGKSSLLDELLLRFLSAFSGLRCAVVAVDPSRRRNGGALLADRMRMNSASHPGIFMRSMATRRQHGALSRALPEVIGLLRRQGFDLIFVETAGIGQGESEIVDLADLSLYVMTADFGAPIQLEKIDMLDQADLVVLNKSDRWGAADALRHVRQEWRREHNAYGMPDADLPVVAAVARRFQDPGVDRLFQHLCVLLGYPLNVAGAAAPAGCTPSAANASTTPILPSRANYLAEIARLGREVREAVEEQARQADRVQGLYQSLRELRDPDLPETLRPYLESQLQPGDHTLGRLRQRYQQALQGLGDEAREVLRAWPGVQKGLRAERHCYRVRGRAVAGDNYTQTLSGQRIPKVVAPRFSGWGDVLRFLLQDNLPGAFPYTAGVYPYRRQAEEPARMFAGEGIPERTNRRFHELAKGQPSVRLSTAFDPVVLYGEDPDWRPDVWGRIGMSGVSIATLDDVKKLYSGFDLADAHTSVSMTINGPAPVVLACFFNAAVDQCAERYLRAQGRWEAARRKLSRLSRDRPRPRYQGELPDGHDGLGLGLLGVSGNELLAADTYHRIQRDVLARVRGTVQADILKEDQAQNECIFEVDFGLRLMGDVQEWFIARGVRNFYSVSVSGYHIAEAGANPITQLAFTLANGFTLVEYYLSRGMRIDDIAPHFSFFFSNGMDAEYAVIGRVARRIWARALRDRYHAAPRSQMLKYHIQTSGRSLQSKQIQLNDIRTTLQALYAIYDNCNSLHTNAYDEAITIPTKDSVRRALAIQLIIQRELGLNANQNPLQGSFIIEELTDLVEEAVYQEFDRLADRGGVLGAMDLHYQRTRIQEESLEYERRKSVGSLPLVGVNTFLADPALETEVAGVRRVFSSDGEKRAQIEAVEAFRLAHATSAEPALERLREAVRRGHNSFETMLEAVRHCTLGQITHALYEVGGQYRRNL